MVSFSCEGCGDVLTKKKLDPHRNQCYGASFTCLDCMVHFRGNEYRDHTSCISEAQKYQGALYRPGKEKKANGNSRPKSAYVEDEEEEHNGHIVIVEPPLPEAPSPPHAVPNFQPTGDVNVFDFLVESVTPNQSTLNLAAAEEQRQIEDTPRTARAIEQAQDYEDRASGVRFYDDEQAEGMLIQYGAGPVPTNTYETPAPNRERKEKKTKEKESKEVKKKDKKRKRLHVDTSPRDNEGDDLMTDAPPVLHSGLTGGLNRLLSRPGVFPPSPDYSGGDNGEPSPASPLKRTKHSKRSKDHRGEGISNTIMSLITQRKDLVTPRPVKTHRKVRTRTRETRHIDPARKLIEYTPLHNSMSSNDDSNQMVVFNNEAPHERAEFFMNFCNKGPDSERGCSFNKALKRYHRERMSLGMANGKGEDEKELWKSIRMKRNERGEIVLFC